MTGSMWIDFLIYLGIICIVVVVVIKVCQAMGIVIPQVVYIIAGGVIGILALIWIGKMLQSIPMPGG